MATKRIRKNVRATNTFTAPTVAAAEAVEALGATSIRREQVRVGDLIRFEPVGRHPRAQVTLRVVEMAGYKAAYGYRARAGSTSPQQMPSRTYELPPIVQLIELGEPQT